MTMPLMRLYSTMPLALMESLLLWRYVRERRLSRARSAALWAVSTVIFTVVRQFENMDGLQCYGYMLALYLCYAVAARMLSGLPWRGVLQRMLSFFLITECSVLALSYCSQRLWGCDVFRSPPIWRMLLALALLGVLQAACLSLMARCLPSTIFADNNSLLISALSVVPYLFVCQITLWIPVNREQLSFAVVILLTMSCFLALVLMANLERRIAHEDERRQMQASAYVARLAEQQFLVRKSSIDALQRNYHDMKNLLLYIEGCSSVAHLHAHVSQILGEIHPFESLVQTGNEVIDILLSEKLLCCQQSGIPCVPMVDGRLLAFIEVADLVCIFGNAMDNAIEGCMAVEDAQKRFIQVRTQLSGSMVLLNFRNGCAPSLHGTGDDWATSKADSAGHGFGLRNIRQAAARYGGVVSCHADGQTFTLTLLFPAAQGQTAVPSA